MHSVGLLTGATYASHESASDQDILTAAYQAYVRVENRLKKELKNESIDTLYLASQTFPDCNQQYAAKLAALLGLDQSCITYDIAGGNRAGSSALRLALRSLSAGASRVSCLIAVEHEQRENRLVASALLCVRSDIYIPKIVLRDVRSTHGHSYGRGNHALDRYALTHSYPKALGMALSEQEKKEAVVSCAGLSVIQTKRIARSISTTACESESAHTYLPTVDLFVQLHKLIETGKMGQEHLITCTQNGVDVVVARVGELVHKQTCENVSFQTLENESAVGQTDVVCRAQKQKSQAISQKKACESLL